MGISRSTRSHRVLAIASFALALLASLTGATTVTAGGRAASTGTIIFGNPNSHSFRFFSIGADGTNEKRLIPGLTCCPALSADGSMLLLAALAPDGRVSTATVGVDGSAYSALPLHRPGLNLGPGAWSPDGTRLAFEGWDDHRPDRTGIYTGSSFDGTALERVTHTPGSSYDVPIAYSPDGARILFWRGPRYNWGNLFVVDIDGTHLTRLNPPNTKVIASFYGQPASWAPDSQRVTFVSSQAPVATTRHRVLYVVNHDGSGLVRLSRGHVTAAWSPDGQWISFEKPIGRYRNGVFAVHPDGRGRHLISSASRASCCAVWSPDGTQVLFTSTKSSDLQSNLWIANVDGSGLTQLTHRRDLYGYFLWAP